MRKRRKWWITGCAVVFLIIGGLSVGGGCFLLNYALCPQMVSLEESEKSVRLSYPQINSWLDSLQTQQLLRDTFIVASDGAKLHAFYVQASQPTSQTAIVVHGYTDKAMEMMHIGYVYHHHLHYNLLLPDLRYAGQTPGEAIQMGWKDRKDVIDWINVAPELFGDSLKIVVHGISMGAATTMMAAGEELLPAVKCFVEDCGYTSVWDQFSKELNGQFGLPDFPLLYVANWICDWKYGWNFKEASAFNQVKKCHLPMLFIHGDQDDYVPTWMVFDLYNVKPAPKELWVTEGVDHAHSYKVYPEQYVQKVQAFTEKYMK